MEIALAPETEQLIKDCVNSGEFASAEEVVSLAIQHLKSPGLFGNFGPGEMMRLITEGENSGPPIPYETFLQNMKAFKEKSRASRK